ncbi:glycosyltransferase family 2 protein [Pseudorhodoferax sp. Leaf267]|uniref:glycosyltransferase family 2 protein n=1 Tax=Pseudorhodoferax sp. Leaf267 TaxID=1736316 RepID=UPI0009EA43B0|nr:glycosyltransferase family 2 protein [Pseudorhodoferax sp. Leaf267]
MSTDRTPSILVVIPTLNEDSTIEGVIDNLARDWPAHGRVTFVVADGGSTDGTVQRVERLAASKPWLSLLHNPKRIQSAAVNLAVRVSGAEADILVRCDAHANYPDGYVRRLVEALERTGADAVVVPMDSVGINCLQRAVAWVSDTFLGSGGSAHRGGRTSGDVDHGHHAAFRMSSFRRAGGYDESFAHNEDAELDCRQRALGSRIYLDSDLRLGYHPRATIAGLWRQYFNYGKGRARTVRKHPGSIRLRQFAVPAFWCANIVSIIASLWLPALLLLPLVYATALLAISMHIAIRKRSVCGLLAGVGAATMHASWAAGFLWSWVALRESPWSPTSALPLVSDPRQPEGTS